MDGPHSTLCNRSSKRHRWNRSEVAERLAAYESSGPESQRQWAEDVGIPRSTLQYWIARKESLDLDPNLVQFLESSCGLAFAHRMLVALHLVFVQEGCCGVRLLCKFLEYSQLDRVIASSFGSQQDLSVQMQTAIVEFGEQERARLVSQMPFRQITLCEDETFHPQICLVAIEPVSNFIVLEKYVEDRTADTWNQQIVMALEGMPVEVIQSTSDESSGLLAHARNGLHAHHSPDLFHVQQEVTHATSLPLDRQVRQADDTLKKQQAKIQALEVERDACREQCSDSVPMFEQQIRDAKTVVSRLERQRQDCEARQAAAREAVAGIGEDYHPFDLQTGQPNDSDQMAAHLKERFRDLEQIADQAKLSTASKGQIAKARRVMKCMVNTILWFWSMVRTKVDLLGLSRTQQSAFYEALLPAHYLRITSLKCQDSEMRQQIQRVADVLLTRARDGPLAELGPEQRQVVDATALQCAQMFQRSSSCVEGRNGQLSLRHHGLHGLTPLKQATLTTLHNYYIRRDDGTTAAQRLFGNPPRDLFEWLMDRIDVPARPAARRKPR